VDSKYLHPSAQVTEDTYHDVCARVELQARVIGVGSETSSAVERRIAGKFQSCECDNEKTHENLAAALSLVAAAAADSRRREVSAQLKIESARRVRVHRDECDDRLADSTHSARNIIDEFWPAPAAYAAFTPVASRWRLPCNSTLSPLSWIMLPSGLGQAKIRGAARPITRSFAFMRGAHSLLLLFVRVPMNNECLLYYMHAALITIKCSAHQ
jgi:hypothetical protein